MSTIRRALKMVLLRIGEVARDLGVTVGENCRFYGVHWGHEPFLVEIGDVPIRPPHLGRRGRVSD